MASICFVLLLFFFDNRDWKRNTSSHMAFSLGASMTKAGKRSRLDTIDNTRLQ